MALLGTQATPEQTIHCLSPVNVVDPEPAANKIGTATILHVQPSGMQVSFVSATQV